MAIIFDQVPATAQLNLVAIELTKEKLSAGLSVVPQRIALIGLVEEGTIDSADVGKPRQVFSADEVGLLYGFGSQLHAMARSLFLNCGSVPVVVFPLESAPVSDSAAMTLAASVSGPTSAGTFAMYVAGERIPIGIKRDENGMSAIATAIQARPHVQVKAQLSDDGTQVTLSSKCADAAGNDILIAFNAGTDESFPENLDINTTGFLSGGLGTADVEDALKNFAEDEVYTILVHPFADETNLKKIEEFEAVRWHPRVSRGFLAVGARRGDYDTAVTNGIAKRNSFVSSIFAQQDIPQTQAEAAAAIGGAVARSAAGDPSLQFHGCPVRGLTVPEASTRWKWEMRDAAVQNGASVVDFVGGDVVVDQAVTTYQTTSQGGVAPPADRYTNSVLTLAAIVYDRQQYFKNVWGRAKLARDGQPLPPGQKIMTPNTMKAELLARYALYQKQGWVQDIEAYAKTLVAEIAPGNPNRINTSDQLILIGNLRISAMRMGWDFAH